MKNLKKPKNPMFVEYRKRLEDIKEKESQIKILNIGCIDDETKKDIEVIESEIEILRRRNLKLDIALQCIDEKWRFIVESKYINGVSWIALERSYNEQFSINSNDFTSYHTLSRNLKDAVDKINSILNIKPILECNSDSNMYTEKKHHILAAAE